MSQGANLYHEIYSKSKSQIDEWLGCFNEKESCLEKEKAAREAVKVAVCPEERGRRNCYDNYQEQFVSKNALDKSLQLLKAANDSIRILDNKTEDPAGSFWGLLHDQLFDLHYPLKEEAAKACQEKNNENKALWFRGYNFSKSELLNDSFINSVLAVQLLSVGKKFDYNSHIFAKLDESSDEPKNGFLFFQDLKLKLFCE